MALKKTGKSALQTRDDVFRMAKEYDEISTQIKSLDKTKKTLSDSIKKLAEKFFQEDDKGSYIGDNGVYLCGKQAKHSITLNTDKALALLKKKNLESIIVRQIVETVDEKKLEQAVAVGDITQEEFESIMNDSVSYAVTVKKLADMPAVEQTTVKKAARKK